jgi:DNA-binding SARP family transcriptional activator/Tfp pilus assembly protein PilF
MLNIQLFGRLTVTSPGGEPIAVTGAKTQGLLAYLALNIAMPASRDRLLALFWGDRFTEQARQSLRQGVARIKRTLGNEEYVIADQDRVGLNSDLVTVDADRLCALAEDPSPEATERAVALLNGPLLEGLYGQQAEFDDWVASERQRLSTVSLAVMERAVNLRVQQQQGDLALALAYRLIEMEPMRDASHGVLIRLLSQKGERAAALQHFRNYEATIMKELGVGAGHELQRLIHTVRGEKLFPEEPKERHPAVADPPAAAPFRARRATVALLPFTTLSEAGDESALAAGLIDDVMTHLSHFSWLQLKQCPDFREHPLMASDLSTLAEADALDYVVHGSLRCIDDRVRLTVKVTDPATARYLWVARYDRRMDDVFALQDELSLTIAASIEAELAGLEGRAARELQAGELSAWECYHRGLAIQYDFNADTNREAQKQFRRAIELDSNFALAHARLAYALVISAIYFEADNLDEVLDEALTLAQRAAHLAPQDAVARFALGRVHLARGDYDRSLSDLRTAVQLNPSLAQAHCALGDTLAYSGDVDGAMPCFEEAVRISPSDPYRWAFLSYGATALLFRGDFEKAAAWAADAESMPNAHYWATAIKASALGHLGRSEEAAKAIEDLRARRPGITTDFVRRRLFYIRDQEQLATYVAGLRRAGLE